MTKFERELKEKELKEIEVFKRFPDLIPYVPENYGEKHKKMLLVWESYYDSWDLLKDKSVEDWYKDADTPKLWELYPSKAGRHWNFKCKINKDGCDKNGGTFLNPERVLEKFEKEDPYNYCAGYNYFLRPALKATTLKNTEKDNEEAFKAFQEIVKVIKPDMIAFLSKKAYKSFTKCCKNTHFDEKIDIQSFVHPASAWWYRKSGKSKDTGEERFEKFIKKW